MAGREALGAADVTDDRLAAMVAVQLGVPHVELLTNDAEVAAYDLEALTTAGRYWVRGTARHDGGDAPFAFFVKVVQSWSRSPVFAYVPAEMREAALAAMPWEREPRIYASDLGDRLPAGLSMPQAYAVEPVDELSAAVWLEAVDVDPVRWDVDRFTRAAHLLGRLAASDRVAPLGALGEVPDVARAYYFGRFEGQVLPTAARRRGLAAPGGRCCVRRPAARRHARCSGEHARPAGGARRRAGLTLHGDACTRNLLVPPGADDGFVLIDFGFWGRGPVGYDLTQLLIGEVQLGERRADELPALEGACLPSYVEGLGAEGVDVDLDQVRRAHALMMLLFAGFSAVPFELLDGPPTDEKLRIARERAGAARFMLDLADTTAPV